MRRISREKKKSRNKGETIVEVMVSFMVLLIVLAIFGNSILAAGEAQRYAIDTRRSTDQGMRQLQSAKYGGKEPGGSKITGYTKTATVNGLDENQEIKAVKYESQTTDGKLVYWVFE